MQNFVFENPTKIILGKGEISKIGVETKRFGSRALFIYGQESIKRFGTYDKVIDSLKKENLSVTELAGVKSNPTLSFAYKGIELARMAGADVIVAVGGGSVMDTAKTIAVGSKMDGDVWDCFKGKKRITDALPVLTVVTVSASASEMNRFAVILNEKSEEKLSIYSPLIQPKTSILDPSLLFTLPSEYSAYSAVDAISHLLEGYFNNMEPMSHLQDRLVEGIIKTIIESTSLILKEPSNYNARADMMWCSTLSYNGLTTAGMGRISMPVHMIAHSLSALYDTPHGASISVVLPAWMEYFSKGNKTVKMARLARNVLGVPDKEDQTAAYVGISRLKSWFSEIGSPTSLREAKIGRAEIEKIAENASRTAVSWQLKDYNKDNIVDILSLCA
ncbi:MAG: iron-containing alcohol dehydrogenase [Desulfobacteraceae bacterium]|nr:MAG: iron-containing alcohol dehydrogenase [Desulfobacteraceae bacterium]